MPRGRGLRPRGLGLRLRLDPGEQTRIRASDRPPRPRRGSVRRASPRRMSSAARFAGGGTPRRRAARRRRGDDDDRSRRRRRRPSAPRPRSRSRSLRPTEETLLRLEGLRARLRSGRRATRAVGLGAGARRGFRASGSSRWRSRRGLAGFGDPPASSARRASSGLARRRRARPARGPRAGGRRASERTSRGGSGAAPRADAPRAGRVPSRLLVIGRAREILHRGGARRARRERALEMRARRALRVRGGVWTRVGAAARGRGFEPAASRPHSRPGRGRARASGRLPAPWESAAGRRERGGREKRTKLDPEMRERSAREKCRSHRQGFFFSDSRGNWAIIPRPPRVAA